MVKENFGDLAKLGQHEWWKEECVTFRNCIGPEKSANVISQKVKIHYRRPHKMRLPIFE